MGLAITPYWDILVMEPVSKTLTPMAHVTRLTCASTQQHATSMFFRMTTAFTSTLGECGGCVVDSDDDGICDNIDGCISAYDEVVCAMEMVPISRDRSNHTNI